MRLGFRGRLVVVSTATFFLALLSCRSQTSVWIDCDPAMGMLLKDSDDSMALAYALKSPRLRIEGISVSYGNSYLPKSQKVAQDVVSKFAANPGAQSALIFPGAGNRKFVGMATEATVALQGVLLRKKLIYIALGPLTNLATLLETRPALAKNVDQVIWVAGRRTGSVLTIGDTNPYSFHDSNFEKDPHAAEIVLDAKIPLTLVSRELAGDFLMSREDQKAIAESGAAGKWLSGEMDHWLTLWKAGWNLSGGPLPDVVAVVAVTHPSSVQVEPAFAGLSMDLKSIVTPKEGQDAKYLLVGGKPSAGQDRPVSYVTKIADSARESWLKVMTEKSK